MWDVAADVFRHAGQVSRTAMVQQVVAEVQARTGETVSSATARAYLEDVRQWFEDHQVVQEEAVVDPWDAVNEALDAELAARRAPRQARPVFRWAGIGSAWVDLSGQGRTGRRSR